MYGLPLWLSDKESAHSRGEAGDSGSARGFRRSPGGGHGNPLHYYSLKDPMVRGAWPATVHGVVKSQAQLKRLGTAHGYICICTRRETRTMNTAQPYKRTKTCHLHATYLDGLGGYYAK